MQIPESKGKRSGHPNGIHACHKRTFLKLRNHREVVLAATALATIAQGQGRNVVVLKSLILERKTYRIFRPIALPASLESLTGRRIGVVQLPVELDWGPNKTYDLSDPYFERQYYQTVIEETLNPAVFSKYLDGHRLVELWPTLWLSATLRDAWEAKFPELR